MAMAAWQATITDDAGNVVVNPTITVQREVPGLPLATCYADKDGNTLLGNPFTSNQAGGNNDGYVRFYVVGGFYRITATSGAFSRSWQDVAIGNAAGFDTDTLPAPALMQRRTSVHVESFGAVGFLFDEINEDDGFSAVVDDTTAFEAAIEAAIDEGHRRVVWNRCHAINIAYDSLANDRYRGLELIGPGAANWREPRTGIITPFDINEPAMTFGDDAGRFYGLIGHGLQFDDLRYDTSGSPASIVTRGGKYGLKLGGFRECKFYNPSFGALAERALWMVGGDSGSFFNHFYGARFNMSGPANAAALYADQGTDFITTTWFHGASFDQPSDAASGHKAIHMIGANVGLTLFATWFQLQTGIIKIEEASAGEGGGVLSGYDNTVEAPGLAVEVDLSVFGGGSFRSKIHEHITGTWEFTEDVEIGQNATGYTGGDTVSTLSGAEAEQLPTMEGYSKRGIQGHLPNAAGAQWLLANERIMWMDISQATVLEPADILPGQPYTLFVRAVGADRAFSFDAGSGVTTYVSGFSGTVQAGTVTRFDCFAGQIPSGDLVLFAAATERYVGASGSRIWKALASGAAGANSNTAQPWFPSGGTLTLPASTAYRFRGSFHSTRAAGSNNHTTSILFGGTATLTSIGYKVHVKTGDAAGLADSSMVESSVATSTQIKAASTSTTEVIAFTIEGIVRINAAGTFIPQFIYSAAPGGAPTIQANTFFELEPIGANTSESVGPWS